jgi:hypothetical protein
MLRTSPTKCGPDRTAPDPANTKRCLKSMATGVDILIDSKVMSRVIVLYVAAEA